MSQNKAVQFVNSNGEILGYTIKSVDAGHPITLTSTGNGTLHGQNGILANGSLPVNSAGYWNADGTFTAPASLGDWFNTPSAPATMPNVTVVPSLPVTVFIPAVQMRPDIAAIKSWLEGSLSAVNHYGSAGYSLKWVHYTSHDPTDKHWSAMIEYSGGYTMYHGELYNTQSMVAYSTSPEEIDSPEVMAVGDEATDNFFFDERG